MKKISAILISPRLPHGGRLWKQFVQLVQLVEHQHARGDEHGGDVGKGSGEEGCQGSGPRR